MAARNYIKCIAKAILVMRSFDPENSELSVSDMARKVGLPKPTANRILSTLVWGGLLEQNAETQKYMIGPMAFTLGSLYLTSRDVIKRAEPIVKRLNELTGEVVNVHIRDKGFSTIVLREESKRTFRFAYHVGSVFPAYAVAAGKALLSELTDVEIDSLYPNEELVALTQKTIATRTELKKELGQVRESEVAFQSEESRDGIEAVASIIHDATGAAVAAISIATPVFTMNEVRRRQLATMVSLGANLISNQLGYRSVANVVSSMEEISAWWEQNQNVQIHETTPDDEVCQGK